MTSTAQLEELRRGSRYPKLRTILPAHHVGTMINNMQRAIVIVNLPPPPDDMDLHDPVTDVQVCFSEVALAEHASCPLPLSAPRCLENLIDDFLGLP